MGKKKSTPERKIARDAGTGWFVSLNYAKDHPKTTTVETIKVHKRKK